MAKSHTICAHLNESKSNTKSAKIVASLYWNSTSKEENQYFHSLEYPINPALTQLIPKHYAGLKQQIQKFSEKIM